MTSETVLDTATGILKIDRTGIGIAGLESTQLLRVLNKANADWIEAHNKGGGEPPEYMQAEGGGTLVSDTTLDGAVAVADTTIDLTDATDFNSSGAFVVYDNEMPDVVFNTGKTSNQLTGVTGIGFPHSDKDRVVKLYALNTNFRSLRQQDGYRDGVRVEGSEYRFATGDPLGGQFTIVDNAGTKYIWFPRGSSGDYSIIYNKLSASIDDESVSIDIPDTEPENQWFVIWKVVSYGREVLGVEGIDLAESRASKILADQMKKRTSGKRVKLSTGTINMSSRFGANFYNTRAGYSGFYR